MIIITVIIIIVIILIIIKQQFYSKYVHNLQKYFEVRIKHYTTLKII